MRQSLKKLRDRLQGTRPKILDRAIPLAGLEAALCARYGYGLTVKCGDDAYFFHLPDIAEDSCQSSLLKEKVFPDEELLLRLRRRTHQGMTILEACAGFGARAIFYAKSMRAGRVYALGGTARNVSLSRKNILLNDVDDVVQAHWLDSGEGRAQSGALDDFCRDQKINNVGLISLDESSLAFVSLESATEILRKHGPAIIIWGQWGAEAAKLRAFLDGLGYAEPEVWTPRILFWMSRV